MLLNGHLIETVKEERKPVNLNEILDNADISEEGKHYYGKQQGGNMSEQRKYEFTGKLNGIWY